MRIVYSCGHTIGIYGGIHLEKHSIGTCYSDTTPFVWKSYKLNEHKKLFYITLFTLKTSVIQFKLSARMSFNLMVVIFKTKQDNKPMPYPTYILWIARFNF